MSYREPAEPAYDDTERATRKPQRDGRHTIEEHLEQLDREVMILAEIVDRAEVVLGPAMRPEEPTPADPEGNLAAIRQQSPLGDRIEATATRVRVRARKLGELLDRVDL